MKRARQAVEAESSQTGGWLEERADRPRSQPKERDARNSRQYRRQDLASSIRHQNVSFPPIRTDIGVPLGSFLKPATSSTEGGRSYISRSGFKDLAYSSPFVKNLEQDVDELLAAFLRDWAEVDVAAGDTNGSKDGVSSSKGKQRRTYFILDVPPLEQNDITSPFNVFCKTYYRLGWQYMQLTWSEHELTRRAMFDTVVREFVDHLKLLLEPITKEDSQGICIGLNVDSLTPEMAQRICACLFALYLIQATTILTDSDRWCPRPSGRIAIEADIFNALVLIPTITSKAFGEGPASATSASSDDVAIVLRRMLGFDAPETRCVFDILPPLQYGIRRPKIRNHLSTRAERDSGTESYGYIGVRSNNAGQEEQRFGQSRATLVHNLLRERLDLPIGVPNSSGRKLRQSEISLLLPDPHHQTARIGGTELVVGRRGASRVGPDLPPSRQAQNELDERVNAIAQIRSQYDGLARSIFGEGGIDHFIHHQGDAEGSHSNGRPGKEIWRTRGRLDAAHIIRDALAQTQRTLRHSIEGASSQK